MANKYEVRILITGSRHWPVDQMDTIISLMKFLQEAFKSTLVIIHGAARGVDSMTENVCNELGISTIPIPVNTKLDGPWPAAGIKRNQRMIDKHNPALVIAFRAQGKSNGTDSCLAYADKMGITTVIVKERVMYAS